LGTPKIKEARFEAGPLLFLVVISSKGMKTSGLDNFGGGEIGWPPAGVSHEVPGQVTWMWRTRLLGILISSKRLGSVGDLVVAPQACIKDFNLCFCLWNQGAYWVIVSFQHSMT